MEKFTMISTHFKRLITFSLLAAGAVFLASGSVAQAQTRWLTEWTSPTAGSEPLFAKAVTDDAVFFTERSAGKLGRLNPGTNLISEWTVFGLPHDLIFGQGAIFFANQSALIGKFAPGTGQLTYWQIPGTQPQHLELVGNIVWFTDGSGSIGRLNLVTGAVRLWPIPGSDPPNGIDIDRSGRFIGFLGVTNAGILDTVTNTFSQWPQPGNPGTTGHVQFSGKYLFFGSNNPTPLNRLNPVTNTVRSWALPTPSGIGDLTVWRDDDDEDGVRNVDLTESVGKVATFDTDTPGIDQVEAPSVHVVVPVDSTVTPIPFGVIARTDTTVVPVRTLVHGVRTGEFVEWAVPTVNPLLGGIFRLDEHAILFTERTGNKVGILGAGDDDHNH
jgi:streptogramin lyase